MVRMEKRALLLPLVSLAESAGCITFYQKMNVALPESLFFVDLPDFQRLCAIKIILNPRTVAQGMRDVQIKLCRHLLFMQGDIVASPEPEHLDQILVVTSIEYYKTGKVQAIAETHEATISTPERVSSNILQTCLSYSLTTWIAPYWNKAGHLLIQGEHFLSISGRQNAVEMQLNVSDSELCISVKAYTIRLPPCELLDFNIATEVLHSFMNDPKSAIKRNFIPSNWCYILPSMKMGQIVSINHTIPPESPFKTYKDLQLHWNMLVIVAGIFSFSFSTQYGYRLPQALEENMIYCSVYFKLIGDKLFTYPFSCIRSQPIQYLPRVDHNMVLTAFVSDLKGRLSHLCGFPLSFNNKPLYPTTSLNRTQSQTGSNNLVNLSTELNSKSLANNARFMCYYAACSADTDQEKEPVIQKTEVSAVVQKLHASQLVINPAASASLPFLSQESSQACARNIQRTEPSLQTREVQNNSSNHFARKHFKQTVPVNSYSMPFTHNQKGNARAAIHGEASENKEMLAKNVPTTLNYPTSPASHSIKPLFISKCKTHTKNVLQNGQTYLPQREDLQTSHKRRQQRNSESALKSACKPASSCYTIHTEDSVQEGYFHGKNKKPKTKPAIQHVDVGSHARNNQLSKLNNATLQNWLKQHGISTKARYKKEELVAKIMEFLNDA